MSDSTIWWALAGLVVSAELITGTFYLLMLSLGLASGALAAHAGLPLAGQLVCAALVGSGAVIALQKLRPRAQERLPHQANADVNMDIGQTLHIAQWQTECTTQAQYRGAMWAIELMPDNANTPPAVGVYRIREVEGNRLRVSLA